MNGRTKGWIQDTGYTDFETRMTQITRMKRIKPISRQRETDIDTRMIRITRITRINAIRTNEKRNSEKPDTRNRY